MSSVKLIMFVDSASTEQTRLVVGTRVTRFDDFSPYYKKLSTFSSEDLATLVGKSHGSISQNKVVQKNGHFTARQTFSPQKT